VVEHHLHNRGTPIRSGQSREVGCLSAQNVVTGAVQDGARVAASEDRSLADGMSHTRGLLEAGLGRSVDDVSVGGAEGTDAVSVEAQGRLRLIIPWAGDARLPIAAQSVVSKERFRAGPSR